MTFLKWIHFTCPVRSQQATDDTDGQYSHYSLSKHRPSKYECHERKGAWSDNYSNTQIIIIIIINRWKTLSTRFLGSTITVIFQLLLQMKHAIC
jgi:hypothetical protein